MKLAFQVPGSALLALVLSTTSAVAAKADGGFLTTCDPATIKVTGTFLSAKCTNILKRQVCTKLDLNNCITNSYGVLDVDETGEGPHFGDKNQCISCSTDPSTSGFVPGNSSPSLMHCQCNPGTGASQASWPTAFFDLNTIVSNNNGFLYCFERRAIPC